MWGVCGSIACNTDCLQVNSAEKSMYDIFFYYIFNYICSIGVWKWRCCYDVGISGIDWIDYYDTVVLSAGDAGWEHYCNQPKISELVSHDFVFIPEEAWEEIEEDAIVDTEHIDEISTSVMDLNLKVNGVEEGVKAYSEVVKLLLQYYDGILY